VIYFLLEYIRIFLIFFLYSILY